MTIRKFIFADDREAMAANNTIKTLTLLGATPVKREGSNTAFGQEVIEEATRFALSSHVCLVVDLCSGFVALFYFLTDYCPIIFLKIVQPIKCTNILSTILLMLFKLWSQPI